MTCFVILLSPAYIDLTQSSTLGFSILLGSLLVLNNRRLFLSFSFVSRSPIALYIPSIFSPLQVIPLALSDLGILATFLHFYLTILSQYFQSFLLTQFFRLNSFFELHGFPSCCSNSSTSPKIQYCQSCRNSSSLFHFVLELDKEISVFFGKY